MSLRLIWPLVFLGCQDAMEPSVAVDPVEAVQPLPASPPDRRVPQFSVTASADALAIRAAFSSYCSPEPTLEAAVTGQTVQVSVKVPEGSRARCVETWHRTARVAGLSPGTYTVQWAAGGLDDQSVVVGPASAQTADP